MRYNRGMPILLPTELQREVDANEGRPVPLVHAETGKVFVLVEEGLFHRLQALVADFDPSVTYAAADNVMAEDWDDPKMAEYDHYEMNRP